MSQTAIEVQMRREEWEILAARTVGLVGYSLTFKRRFPWWRFGPIFRKVPRSPDMAQMVDDIDGANNA